MTHEKLFQAGMVIHELIFVIGNRINYTIIINIFCHNKHIIVIDFLVNTVK